MHGAPSAGFRPATGPDRPTLASVYQEHAHKVARWAARLGGPDAEVEDILQEVFFIAHRKLAVFRGDSQISTWLFAITRNVVRQRIQRERVRRFLMSVVSRETEEPAAGSTPLEDFERRESLDLVYRALEGLPEKHRTAFILFEIEGLSGPEIAELTGLSPATLRVRLFRARAQFAERLRGLVSERSARRGEA